MKKILLISSSFPRHSEDASNAGRFVYDIAVELQSIGYIVEVLTFSAYQDDDIKSHAIYGRKTAGVPISYIDVKTLIGIYTVCLAMFRGIVHGLRISRRLNPDFILCFWSIPSGIFAMLPLFLFKIPFYCWVLGSDILEAGRYPLGRQVNKLILRNAQGVFADGVSLANQTELLAGVSVSFLPSSRNLAKLEKQVDVKKGSEPYIATIARLHHHKGIDLLLRAYKICLAQNKNFPILKVFGDGPLAHELANLSLDLGLAKKVKFEGLLKNEDLKSTIGNAEFIVIPSRQDSIPLVLGEACSFGRALVATDVGDMGVILRKHQAGFIAQPDEHSIAMEMLKCWENTNQKDPGLRAVAAELSFSKSISKITGL